MPTDANPSKSVFARRLWAMQKEGKAFRYDSLTTVVYMVPTGPYTGTWIFAKDHKRLHYKSQLDRLNPTFNREVERDLAAPVVPRDEPGASLRYQSNPVEWKTISLPLPTCAYDAEGIKYAAFSVLHTGDRAHHAGRAVARWKAFKANYYSQFIGVCDQVAESLQTTWVALGARQLGPTVASHLPIFAGFALPTLLQQAAKDPQALVHKLYWLATAYQQCHFPNWLGVRRRQKFVRRVLEDGPKQALRKTCKALHPRTINSILDSGVHLTSVVSRMGGCKASLDIFRGPFTINQISRMGDLRNLGYSKEYIDRYARKWNTERALAKLATYKLERGRLPIDDLARYPAEPWANPEIIDRWHDEMVAIIRARLDKATAATREVAENVHRKRWSSMELLQMSQLGLPVRMRPLITKEEFEVESDQMRHCIRNYHLDQSAVFAHLEMGTEQASLMVDYKTGGIIQLFGPKNGPVSNEMQMAAADFAMLNWRGNENRT